MSKLEMGIQYIKGVGPKRAKKFKKLNIEKVQDLIYYFPRTYEDRRKFSRIKDCVDGQKVNLQVEVAGVPTVFRPRKGLSISKVSVKDETGYAELVWFNQDYITKSIKKEQNIRVNGTVKRKFNMIEINNPIVDKSHHSSQNIGRIIPIYPLTNNLSNMEIIKIMEYALMEYGDQVEEIFPYSIRQRFNLISIQEAIHNIHFPDSKELYLKSKERLAFEELLILQLGLLTIKTRYKKNNTGLVFNKGKDVDKVQNTLSFTLTSAQKRVMKEIFENMESNKTMNRLVQGDVGSGKTVIAALAIYKAVRSGYQAVMMAPTEILAMQHFESIDSILRKFNIKTLVLVGNLSQKKKNEVLESIKKGEVDVVIGTHAIIQESVVFNKLGLAITDEQHRFGVRQRAHLSRKGENPDILVMTATPIPRTLALIVYGDLDISIIDELPPGRKKIETYSVGKTMKDRVYHFVRKQVVEGRQGYIVCPLVEESEKLDIQSAIELYKILKESYFKDFEVALLHGKMPSKEKDSIMSEFKKGRIDILISTTVIEVGVNVPNANIMIIENAERFGLAQLHQLRGRVGRGQYQSYCILINEGTSQISRERMKIMERTNDGFIISEKDLKLRGPGELFGTRQHGLPDLKIANIFTDMRILKMAQGLAQEIIENDLMVLDEKYSKINKKMKNIFKEKLEEVSMN